MKLMVTILSSLMICSSVYAAEVTKNSTVLKSDNLFTQADKDHDNKLSPAEFDVFKQLQEDRLTQQIKQRIDQMQFSSFDKDGDKGVTQDELKAARVEARQKMMQKMREHQLQIKPVATTPVSSAEQTKK